jgi:hypothetical protein
LTALQSTIDEFFNAISLLRNRGWVKLGLGPTMNTIFDMHAPVLIECVPVGCRY